MLARITSICGPISPDLLQKGRAAHFFYTRSGEIWEKDANGQHFTFKIERSSIAAQVPAGIDPAFVDFLELLLKTDPAQRPTAESALQHPWLSS
jgi:serine/threonine protein kinase